MTPGERVVVEAAIRYRTEEHPGRGAKAHIDLLQAVDVLLTERELLAERDTPAELDLTWGQVVEGDEIYSAKTDRWYPVTRTVRSDRRQADHDYVKVNALGIPKAIQANAAGPVKVRRGATGTAVDMFAVVLWSAQTRPETVHIPETVETLEEP